MFSGDLQQNGSQIRDATFPILQLDSVLTSTALQPTAPVCYAGFLLKTVAILMTSSGLLSLHHKATQSHSKVDETRCLVNDFWRQTQTVKNALTH